GCNCQFALNPDSFEYAVIEVNPRVSRSSALASKATGYQIAKVAALIAVGFTLDEIPNFVTKKTKACFEPVLDYVVVKMPKFPFDKFVYAARKLGTQMKATGEVMAIGQNFEEAVLKAVRGLEIGVRDLNLPAFEKEGDEKIRDRVGQCTDQRIFAIYQALKRHLMTVEEIHDITKIDEWFLWKLEKIAGMDCRIKSDNDMTREPYLLYPPTSFKMVDTCAGEFDAETPYFYSTSDAALYSGTQENEAELFLKENNL
ncbi:MAG: carbamoyl phosphate synthase large subunit, partial [Treponema sp.]|nr:carbamoyl phosphate synthase large subunit [Treponema sp.]